MNLKLSRRTVNVLLSVLLAACTSASSARQYDPNHATPSLWRGIQQQQGLNHHTNQLAVKKQIIRYCHHTYQIEQTLQQSLPLIATIAQQAEAAKLPSEVSLIPYIESHYNPLAYSHTGATGLWQMMPGTASGFGLRINWWVDQRKDIEASTEAALAYLGYLYHYFDNNWLLAIAAYDAGEGTIRSAVRHNRQHHQPTDFWSLKLPKETEIYIPRLLALAEIIQNPEKCHLNLPAPKTSSLTAVPVTQQLSFRQIAQMALAPPHTIEKYNPHYLHHMTENIAHDQMIYLPAPMAHNLSLNLAKHPMPVIHWQHHQARNGDSVKSLALLYHTSAEAIRQCNPSAQHQLTSGQHLLIPIGKVDQLTQHLKFRPTSHTSQANTNGPQQHIHKIKLGENLSQIAHQYHLTPGMIRYWNPQDARGKLKPGKQLILWLPRKNQFDEYQVVSGDNLSLLANRFGVPIRDIKDANQLRNNIIHPGQTMKIPMSTKHSNTKHPLIYTVQSGDSLYSIGLKHTVSIRQLKTWNQLQESSIIQPGQSLTLYR